MTRLNVLAFNPPKHAAKPSEKSANHELELLFC